MIYILLFKPVFSLKTSKISFIWRRSLDICCHQLLGQSYARTGRWCWVKCLIMMHILKVLYLLEPFLLITWY